MRKAYPALRRLGHAGSQRQAGHVQLCGGSLFPYEESAAP